MIHRKATLKDIPDLNRISVASKKHWGYPDEWIEKWLDDLTLTPAAFAQQHILVGELNAEIVGFCAIAEQEDAYEILHLWVLPTFIGCGYGKKLLIQAMEEFIKTDKAVKVVADPNAEAFYERQGFATYDRVESFPPGRYLPVMKKGLPAAG